MKNALALANIAQDKLAKRNEEFEELPDNKQMYRRHILRRHFVIIEIDSIKFNFDFPNEFRVSANEIDEIHEMVKSFLLSINQSDDLRMIVIESWFIIEFFVKRMLGTFYHFDELRCNCLNPESKLLPFSFSACISNLETILKSHRNLPLEPRRNGINADLSFWLTMQKENPDLFKQLCEYEAEYNVKRDEGGSNSISLLLFKHYQHPCVKFCDFMDNEWFSKVRIINRARNKAAHYRNVRYIHDILKLDDFEQSKEFCLKLVYQTCFVSIC